MGQAGDFTKDVLDLTIVTFLEHEYRLLEASEPVGLVSERVWVFLHGVADEDEGAELEQLGFLGGVGKDLLDLGFSGAAHRLRHDVGEMTAIGHPAGGAALAEAAV